MKTTRIVLTEPFIKHPASLVFELNEAMDVSEWEEDDRLREKLSFLDKRTYHLPDGGNGSAYKLPLSSTAPCPPEVFEHVNLKSGPCRLTYAGFQGNTGQNDVWNPGFNLLEINGLNAQGFEFPMKKLERSPAKMELFDRLRQEVIRTLPVADHIDGSDLAPGFYELRCYFQKGDIYQLRFIKSFPLLVSITRPNGPFTVQKTLY